MDKPARKYDLQKAAVDKWARDGQMLCVECGGSDFTVNNVKGGNIADGGEDGRRHHRAACLVCTACDNSYVVYNEASAAYDDVMGAIAAAGAHRIECGSIEELREAINATCDAIAEAEAQEEAHDVHVPPGRTLH